MCRPVFFLGIHSRSVAKGLKPDNAAKELVDMSSKDSYSR